MPETPTPRELTDLRALLSAGGNYKLAAHRVGCSEPAYRKRLERIRARHGFASTENAIHEWTLGGFLVAA